MRPERADRGHGAAERDLSDPPPRRYGDPVSGSGRCPILGRSLADPAGGWRGGLSNGYAKTTAIPLQAAGATGSLNMHLKRLGDQPVVVASKLSFIRGVLTAVQAIRSGAAPPTERHPTVRFWRMMLIESNTHLRCFD